MTDKRWQQSIEEKAQWLEEKAVLTQINAELTASRDDWKKAVDELCDHNEALFARYMAATKGLGDASCEPWPMERYTLRKAAEKHKTLWDQLVLEATKLKNDNMKLRTLLNQRLQVLIQAVPDAL